MRLRGGPASCERPLWKDEPAGGRVWARLHAPAPSWCRNQCAGGLGSRALWGPLPHCATEACAPHGQAQDRASRADHTANLHSAQPRRHVAPPPASLRGVALPRRPRPSSRRCSTPAARHGVAGTAGMPAAAAGGAAAGAPAGTVALLAAGASERLAVLSEGGPHSWGVLALLFWTVWLVMQGEQLGGPATPPASPRPPCSTAHLLLAAAELPPMRMQPFCSALAWPGSRTATQPCGRCSSPAVAPRPSCAGPAHFWVRGVLSAAVDGSPVSAGLQGEDSICITNGGVVSRVGWRVSAQRQRDIAATHRCWALGFCHPARTWPLPAAAGGPGCQQFQVHCMTCFCCRSRGRTCTSSAAALTRTALQASAGTEGG